MKTAFIVLFVICPAFSFAQITKLRFTNYSLSELPGKFKSRIVQDKFGYIWIPTADGLYRYDGVELKHYFHKQSDSNSLSINFVTCVYSDSDGSIWVGTFDGGLNHLDPLTGNCKVYRYNKDDAHSISSDRIFCVMRDSRNLLWVGTEGHTSGLNIFNEKENNFQRIELGEKGLTTSLKAANNKVNFINETRHGELLVSTFDGLWIRDAHSGKFSVYRCDTAVSRLRNNLMGVTFEHPDNFIWICTWGGGIKKFNHTTKTFETYLWNEKNKNTGTNNIAHDILLNNSNELWIASVDKGFGVFNISSGKFNFYSPDAFYLSTPGYGVYNLMKEKNGNIWMILDNSTCAKIDWNKQTLPFVNLALKKYNHNPLPQVDAIVKTNNYVILSASWSNGFYVFDEKTKLLRECKAPDNKLVSGGSLMKDHSGKIWAVSGKLYNVDLDDATLLPFQSLNYDSIPYLYEVVEDKNHDFWFSSADGIIYYDRNKNLILHYTSDQLKLKPGAQVHGLICDDKGDIWSGSDENGLYIFNASTKKFININNTPGNNILPFSTVLNFTTDNKKRIWACGIGGVAICEEEKGKLKFKSLSFENGLANNHINNIAFDGKDAIWVNGVAGNISKINIKDISVHNYDEKIFGDYPITSLSVDDKGILYMGSSMGFLEFSPSDISYDTTPPVIAINAFKVFDDLYPVPAKGGIKLKYNQNYFSFDFAAITFSNADKCSYAYMLEGFDKDGVDAGTRRYAAYTNIPGGDYTFKVKGANADGIWNETGVSIPIFITTPFWKTWWFYTLLAFVVTSIIVTVYRYRISQLIKLQKMRTQIATDLHDDIGSTLTSISFYSEMVKMQLNENDKPLKNLVEKMGSSARNMVSAMSDIIWVINPRNDVSENLIARMKSHAAQILNERNIQYRFKADELSNIQLSMEQKKNIYLIYKEALHNAVNTQAAAPLILISYRVTTISICK